MPQNWRRSDPNPPFQHREYTRLECRPGRRLSRTAQLPAQPVALRNQRTLTADGRRLVRFNPAPMTRQIAERFQSKTMNFHICGLSPKRPQNRPSQWETSALLDFNAGKTERFQLVPGREEAYLRYRHRCGRRKAVCNAIRTKPGMCSAASAYSIPAFQSLLQVEQRDDCGWADIRLDRVYRRARHRRSRRSKSTAKKSRPRKPIRPKAFSCHACPIISARP